MSSRTPCTSAWRPVPMAAETSRLLHKKTRKMAVRSREWEAVSRVNVVVVVVVVVVQWEREILVGINMERLLVYQPDWWKRER